MITPKVMSVTVGTSHPSDDRTPRDARNGPAGPASAELAASPPPTRRGRAARALPPAPEDRRDSD